MAARQIEDLDVNGTLTAAALSGTPAIATDTIWAAKGDIVAATADNAAAVVTVGANDTMLVADSAQGSGVKWTGAIAPTSVASTGAVSGTSITATAGALTIGGGTGLSAIERESTTTNNVVGISRIIAKQTTGTMSDGFGPTLIGSIRNSGGTLTDIGLFGLVRAGADNTGDFIIKPYASGSSNERFRVTSAGNTTISGTLGCGAITSSGAFSNSGYNMTTNAITATGLTIGSDAASSRLMTMNTAAGNTNTILFGKAGTVKASIQCDATEQLIFKTGTNATALTLDASQNATLVGYLKITGIRAVSATGAASAPELAHGQYTPTLTNTTNVTSSTARVCNTVRVGNQVMVFGYVSVVVTTGATSTFLNISLPVASAFTLASDLSGQGNPFTVACTLQPTIYGDATNDNAQMFWTPASSGSQDIYFCFGYIVK